MSWGMTFEVLDGLLAVQEAEARVGAAEAELKRVPVERAKLGERKASAEAALESARASLRSLELRRKDLETEVGQIEAQVVKYKTQQLEVKKNEEYTALTHEIEKAEGKASELETTELEVMLEIDEAKEAQTAAESAHAAELKEIATEEGFLETREREAQEELGTAKEAAAAAREKVEVKAVRVYDTVKRSVKSPWIVPLEAKTCQGCRLKVSNETLGLLRDPETIARCDNCGRIVYDRTRDL